MAGNAIGHKKNFPKCFPSPGDTFWYPACVNTPIGTTIIISNFGKKSKKVPKLSLSHRNFLAVNSLEKIQKISPKRIKKFEKLYFF